MGTKKDRKYTATKELYFSVKSMSVKTPEVPEVEIYHFSRLFTTTSYKSDKKKTC